MSSPMACGNCNWWDLEVDDHPSGIDYGRCRHPIPIPYGGPVGFDDQPTTPGSLEGCPCWSQMASKGD